MRDTKVYAPCIRSRLGTTVQQLFLNFEMWQVLAAFKAARVSLQVGGLGGEAPLRDVVLEALSSDML